MSNDLSTYLDREKLDDAAFGLLVGKDRTTINRWKKGRGTPTLADAAKVEKVTKGEVSMSSWVSTPDGAAQ